MKRILLILALVWVSSCNDWLDLKPYDGVVEQDYWKTKEDVYSELVGCYASLLNSDLITRLIYWGELRADMITAGASASSKELNIIRGEISPDNDIVKWDVFYTSIGYCNKLIEKSSEVRQVDLTFTEELHNRYVAEATTIRSLLYFYLVRSFKEVPLVLKASNSDGQDFYFPKAEERVILDTLVAQLNRVMPHLALTHATNAKSKGHITRWAAMALLADIYLWQGNYQQCITLCDQIIGSGRYALVPVARVSEEILDETTGLATDTVYIANGGDVETWFNMLYISGNSPESIFELQFPYGDPNLGDPFFSLFNFTGTPRTLLAPNTLALVDGIFPETETLHPSVKDIRTHAYQNNYVWKWIGLTASGISRRVQRYFPNWIIYRYADIILMKAEAMNQLDLYNAPQQWRAYLEVKKVMERANAIENEDIQYTPDNIDGMAVEQLILNERAREFIFEGKRWYDVLRFAKRNNYAGRDYLKQMAINSTPPEKLTSLQLKYDKDGFLYWPIYIKEVEMNKNLVQNEYYQ